MIRSLSLAGVLAAGLALPAVAENAATTPETTDVAKTAPELAETTRAQTPVVLPYRMVRTLGGRQCANPMLGGKRIVWKGPRPPHAQ